MIEDAMGEEMQITGLRDVGIVQRDKFGADGASPSPVCGAAGGASALIPRMSASLKLAAGSVGLGGAF